MLTSGGCGDPIACHARRVGADRVRAAEAGQGRRRCNQGGLSRRTAPAAGQRVPSCLKGRRGLRAWLIVAWCFGTVAWFKSLCAWAALVAPSGGPAPLAVVRRCPCCAGGLVEWAARPTTTVVSNGVIVGLGACVLQPHCAMACPGAAWVGLPRVRGGGWGAGWRLVGRVTTAQARGQLATESVARSG